jgi:hypothetical protein
MRIVMTASLLALLALAAGPAQAGAGHWYCTADGIRSWTTDSAMMDAKGWKYSGDRNTYRDGGHCAKG